MANVVVTFHITPVNSSELTEESSKVLATKIGEILNKEGTVKSIVLEPFVFGLKRFKVQALFDEKKGSVDPFNDLILELSEVESSEVSDVSREMEF